MFSLKINDKNFEYFKNLVVKLNYEGIGSTFSFAGVFDPDNKSHQDLFRPLAYNKVEIFSDNELLLTGTILNNSFQSGSVVKTTTFSGYSVTGVLADCEIPVELYPLQSNNKTLKEIIEYLIKPFGINLVIDNIVEDLVNQMYPKSVASENKSIANYIADLCNQKNIILSHTPQGDLLLTKARLNLESRLLARYTSMKLEVNGQGMHSSVTVLRQSSVNGGNAGQYSVDNLLVNYYRPKVKQQNSGNDNDTQLAAKKALKEQAKNIKLNIELDSWYNDNEILKPKQLLAIKNKELFINNFELFFINQVTFSGDKTKQVASVECVLYDVYNDNDLHNIFE